MTKATHNAIIKLIPLRNREIFRPKYFFSIGKVTKPTIIRVVVNADNIIKVTPSLYNIPASGKTMKPGIYAIEPRDEANKREINLLSLFKSVEINFSGIKYRNMETRIIIKINEGSMLIIFLLAMRKAFFVFFPIFDKRKYKANYSKNIKINHNFSFP